MLFLVFALANTVVYAQSKKKQIITLNSRVDSFRLALSKEIKLSNENRNKLNNRVDSFRIALSNKIIQNGLLMNDIKKENTDLKNRFETLLKKTTQNINISREEIDNKFKNLFNANWIITDIGSRFREYQSVEKNEIAKYYNKRDFLNFDGKWFRIQEIDDLFYLVMGEAERVDYFEKLNYINLENDTLIVGGTLSSNNKVIEIKLYFEQFDAEGRYQKPGLINKICKMSLTEGKKNYSGWAQFYDKRYLLTRAEEFEWVVNNKLDVGYYGDDFEVNNKTLIPFKGTITHLNSVEMEPIITLKITSGSLMGNTISINYSNVEDFYKTFSNSMNNIDVAWSLTQDTDLNIKVEGYMIEGKCKAYDYQSDSEYSYSCSRLIYLDLED